MGAGLVGWQRQAQGTSVQGLLETALSCLTQETISVRAAGRTDAGVHARGQVVSFKTSSSLRIRAFVDGTNGYLPRNVSVLSAEEAPEHFDARHDAIGKWYRYQIWNSPTRSALHQDTFAQVRGSLDMDRMQSAASQLIGTHDFRAFRSADCERKQTIRTISKFAIHSQDDFSNGKELFFDVEGDGFLKQMVRILSGTLIQTGLGRFSVDSVKQLLVTGDRTKAGITAPAHGLFLQRVYYK